MHGKFRRGSFHLAPILFPLLLAVVACLVLGSHGGAQGLKKIPKMSPNDLSMEVAALQTLHYLKLTPAQLDKLQSLAEGTADTSSSRSTAKASDKFRKTLTNLRDVLAQDKENDRIDALLKELDDLRTAEKPELDDTVEITDEARDRAAEALHLLTAAQVAGYAGAYADDIPDPLQQIVDDMEKVRGLGDKEWKDLRLAVSDQIGWLVGGIDADEAAAIGDRAVQLLIVVRSLTDEEFKKQRPELEQTAREIVGDVGPTDVLRHFMERTLGELLSNPRLPNAIDARLK